MGRNYQRDDVPGFFVLWHLLGNSDAVRHDPVLEAWALEELLKSLPAQIGFANDLYYFWLSGPHAFPERLPPIRKAVMEKLRASLEWQDAPSLGDCLNDDFPYNLFHLLYTSNYKEKANGMAPISDDADWAWLGPNLMKAARNCPARVLPQIIIAVQHNEARVVVADFRQHYNHSRPHSKLGYQSPVRFAAQNPRPSSLVEAGQIHPTQLHTKHAWD